MGNEINEIDEWNEAYSCGGQEDILLIRKLSNSGFNNHQINNILKVLDSVCNHCWNSRNGCQCWNDE